MQSVNRRSRYLNSLQFELKQSIPLTNSMQSYRKEQQQNTLYCQLILSDYSQVVAVSLMMKMQQDFLNKSAVLL